MEADLSSGPFLTSKHWSCPRNSTKLRGVTPAASEDKSWSFSELRLINNRNLCSPSSYSQGSQECILKLYFLLTEPQALGFKCAKGDLCITSYSRDPRTWEYILKKFIPKCWSYFFSPTFFPQKTLCSFLGNFWPTEECTHGGGCVGLYSASTAPLGYGNLHLTIQL